MYAKPTVAEFFAGSGLVREGLGLWFKTAWANDVCPKKAAVYEANFGNGELKIKSIADVSGLELPPVDLAWASFPCQDLSLAGKLAGLSQGSRSGLFWEWLRVIDEMPETSRPAVLAIENVVGFLVSHDGENFSRAYNALRERGYLAGAFVMDAAHFVPQSRPRSFIVAVRDGIDLSDLTLSEPNALWHPKSVVSAYNAVKDPQWVWWKLPAPKARKKDFADICDYDAPCDEPETTAKLLKMLSALNRKKLDQVLASKQRLVGTGYKRTRPDESGRKVQRLELRFDGIAGCLRTPEGGSSRQTVIIVEDGKIKTRLLTVREAASLMGARKSYKIPGSYNDGYKAMGDAVAAPVAQHLAEHLLSALSLRAHKSNFSIAAE